MCDLTRYDAANKIGGGPMQVAMQLSSKMIWVPLLVLGLALAMEAINKTISFMSPASPFLAQDPSSPTTSSPSISPPNPPDYQLHLVLPTAKILDRSPLSAVVSAAFPSLVLQSRLSSPSSSPTMFYFLQRQEQEPTYFPFQAHLHFEDLPQKCAQARLQYQLLSSPQNLLPGGIIIIIIKTRPFPLTLRLRTGTHPKLRVPIKLGSSRSRCPNVTTATRLLPFLLPPSK
jgi:hypothetical protein